MRSLHVPSVSVVIGLLLGVVTTAGAQTAGTGPTSPIARGSGSGFAHGTGSGIGRGARSRQLPSLQNRIPAPLPPSPQPPVINGPLTPSGLPPMGGAR
jgi:hypothetical protein